MDWLKNLIKNLPLDAMSEQATQFITWWSDITSGIPDDDLPFYAYVGASVAVLLLLLFVIRIMPRTIGGVFWVFWASVLLTPATLMGEGQVSLAVAGVAHGILMKDYAGAMTSLLPILTVFIVLLCVGAIWQILRGVVETNIAKARETAEIQAKKQEFAKQSENTTA